jgi:hypothetical protein
MATEVLRPNAIEMVMQTEFADGALWQPSKDGRMDYPELAGLADVYVSDGERHVVGDTSRSWVMWLYGQRIAADDADHDQPYETTELAVLPEIHRRLGELVLQDELSHGAELVTPPKPLLTIDGHENNDKWLRTLIKGRWPIMSLRPKPRVEGDYLQHDIRQEHIANMVLMPREAQQAIIASAGYELAWRKQFSDVGDEVAIPRKHLAGEAYSTALPVTRTEKLEAALNGIMIIDQFTDTGLYCDLLHFVMQNGRADVADRTTGLIGLLHASERPQGVAQSDFIAVHKLAGRYGQLINHAERHRAGRNLDPDIMSSAQEQLLRGIGRVARKILL